MCGSSHNLRGFANATPAINRQVPHGSKERPTGATLSWVNRKDRIGSPP
jgi:hypothetical protein